MDREIIPVVDKLRKYKKYLDHQATKTIENQKPNEILIVLKKLEQCKVTVQHMQEVSVCKTVAFFRKHPPPIGPFAKSILARWIELVNKEKELLAGEKDVESPTTHTDNNATSLEEESTLPEENKYYTSSKKALEEDVDNEEEMYDPERSSMLRDVPDKSNADTRSDDRAMSRDKYGRSSSHKSSGERKERANDSDTHQRANESFQRNGYNIKAEQKIYLKEEPEFSPSTVNRVDDSSNVNKANRYSDKESKYNNFKHEMESEEVGDNGTDIEADSERQREGERERHGEKIAGKEQSRSEKPHSGENKNSKHLSGSTNKHLSSSAYKDSSTSKHNSSNSTHQDNRFSSSKHKSSSNNKHKDSSNNNDSNHKSSSSSHASSGSSSNSKHKDSSNSSSKHSSSNSNHRSSINQHQDNSSSNSSKNHSSSSSSKHKSSSSVSKSHSSNTSNKSSSMIERTIKKESDFLTVPVKVQNDDEIGDGWDETESKEGEFMSQLNESRNCEPSTSKSARSTKSFLEGCSSETSNNAVIVHRSKEKCVSPSSKSSSIIDKSSKSVNKSIKSDDKSYKLSPSVSDYAKSSSSDYKSSPSMNDCKNSKSHPGSSKESVIKSQSIKSTNSFSKSHSSSSNDINSSKLHSSSSKDGNTHHSHSSSLKVDNSSKSHSGSSKDCNSSKSHINSSKSHSSSLKEKHQTKPEDLEKSKSSSNHVSKSSGIKEEKKSKSSSQIRTDGSRSRSNSPFDTNTGAEGFSFEDMLNYEPALPLKAAAKRKHDDIKPQSKPKKFRHGDEHASMAGSPIEIKKHMADINRDKHSDRERVKQEDKRDADKLRDTKDDRQKSKKSEKMATLCDAVIKIESARPLTPLELSVEELMEETNAEYMARVEQMSAIDREDKQIGRETEAGSKQHTRTQIYSGRRQVYLTSVPTLKSACLRVLIDNINDLDYVGIPYDILKPVLEACTPTQLYTLEDYNPYLVDDTDELWEKHCARDFKNIRPMDELDTWRELYLRLHDEREAKLKNLTKNITASRAKAVPERMTKLAYVDAVVKPPRDVRRKQIKNNTGGVKVVHTLKPSTSEGARSASGGMSREGGAMKHAGGSSSQLAPTTVGNLANLSARHNASRAAEASKKVKQTAPLMQKTLQFFKGIRRR